MKENIVVIGGDSIGKEMAHLMPDDVIIVDSENVKKGQLQFPKSEPFILHNPYPIGLKSIYEGKQFVCKGKHQYRLTDTIKDEREYGTITREVWSCQCSKVLGQ